MSFTLPDWTFAFAKTYLIVAVILLHHDVVIHKHTKAIALTKSILWLPFYVWKWIELTFNFLFTLGVNKKEKKVKKVDSPAK